ncbi:hypothetical protein AGMMS50293_13190 [Spirochaetia bacterium]|nr:hypothetical protein AGMMS50293_13190 [Spirochaetia bacterium]
MELLAYSLTRDVLAKYVGGGINTAKEFPMKNLFGKGFFKTLGIIVVAAVIGFGLAGCKTDAGDGDGGGAGKLTVTDIPAALNGKWIIFVSLNRVGSNGKLIGAKPTPSRQDMIAEGVLISGTTVQIPVYKDFGDGEAMFKCNPYTGSDANVQIGIIAGVGEWGDQWFDTYNPGAGIVKTVTFTNGNATVSYGSGGGDGGDGGSGGDGGDSGGDSGGGGDPLQNWTRVTDSTFGNWPDPYNYIYSIAYGNGKFVAVGERGKMAYSPDGISWTAVTTSIFDTNRIYGIAYGGGKFVAVGKRPKWHIRLTV